jgi:hypothetical protein
VSGFIQGSPGGQTSARYAPYTPFVSSVSPRLARRVTRDFGPQAPDLLAELAKLPRSPYLGRTAAGAERIQAAVVLGAGGDRERFGEMLRLLRTDWRDALVAARLETDDWPQLLDVALGASD